IGQGEAETIPVTVTAEQRHALLADPLGFVEVALGDRHQGEAAKAPSDTQGIVQLPADGQALLEERAGRRIVALSPGEATGAGEAAGPQPRIDTSRAPLQHLLQPGSSLVGPAADGPPGSQRGAQTKSHVVGLLAAPAQRRSEVVLFLVQAGK